MVVVGGGQGCTLHAGCGARQLRNNSHTSALSTHNRLRLLHTASCSVAKPEDGFGAVVALAWGLSKDAVISRTGPEAGGGAAHDGSLVGPPSTALLEAAGKGRALGTLSALLSSTAFQLEAEQEHRCVADAADAAGGERSRGSLLTCRQAPRVAVPATAVALLLF